MRAQLLDRRRPTEIVDTVRRLTLLQIDPTAAVAPNADLVLWSRLGATYRPEQLKTALEGERSLFELDALVRPIEDLRLFRADMATRPQGTQARAWLEANSAFRIDILDRLRERGPLRSRDIPDTSAVPWASTGWTNNRNVTQMLELLVVRGEIAISRREGRERFWDLAERVYPSPGDDEPPLEEALRMRDERRLRALGIARPTAPQMPMEPTHVGAAGVEAEVEGVPGTWRVDPDALDGDDHAFEGRTALLSPFDRLIHDRVRAQALFDFEYVLEMYKPAAQRRWGYFALPILHGDRLVGKADVLADRKRGRLVVNALHEDVPFDAEIRNGVELELDDLSVWLGLCSADGSGPAEMALPGFAAATYSALDPNVPAFGCRTADYSISDGVHHAQRSTCRSTRIRPQPGAFLLPRRLRLRPGRGARRHAHVPSHVWRHVRRLRDPQRGHGAATRRCVSAPTTSTARWRACVSAASSSRTTTSPV